MLHLPFIGVTGLTACCKAFTAIPNYQEVFLKRHSLAETESKE